MGTLSQIFLLLAITAPSLAAPSAKPAGKIDPRVALSTAALAEAEAKCVSEQPSVESMLEKYRSGDSATRVALKGSHAKFREYLLCRAVASRDPELCRVGDSLGLHTSTERGVPICRYAYQDVMLILLLAEGKKAEAVKFCVKELSSRDADKSRPRSVQTLCPLLMDAMAAGSSPRAICTNLKRFLQPDEDVADCAKGLAHLAGRETDCSKLSSDFDRAVCATMAGLGELLRTKNKEYCETLPACRAAILADPKECAAVGAELVKPFCASVVFAEESKKSPKVYLPQP